MFEYDQSEHRECTRKRLDKHKIIIHEAIWHQCDICRYRSTQGIHLENHKKVKHAHKPVSLNKILKFYAMPVLQILKKVKRDHGNIEKLYTMEEYFNVISVIKYYQTWEILHFI